jgi:polyphosphate kinase
VPSVLSLLSAVPAKVITTRVGHRAGARRSVGRLIDVYLHDNCTAWDMRSDGSFQRRIPEEENRAAQLTLMEHWRSGLNDSDDATP